MYLSDYRYEEIKEEVVDMYEECELQTYPIDCAAIANRLGYRLLPYSALREIGRAAAMKISTDGFHILMERKCDHILFWVIFYNDANCRERQRWTILHEIGHIRLDHTQGSLLAESEANFFAKYAIAPPPLIYIAGCEDFVDIAEKFDISMQAAYYAMDYYVKWLNYSPVYTDNEIRLLSIFGIAA